ncbi:AraC family transcriptional regulator [Paenibacillus sp. ACRRY]|uniref:helix-turn-helix domain-containing protein n=1 Tax=Paenibacillus sp. ACRRY TaxID=2918208 RepID=UPI001EF55077|nr:AraC family transcriptional regulator [Paenibacillus sp. ACRRY]MCG7382057.1 AraC family transcriptional regulator [Paenibacillus sp. ACRRY]
MGVRTGKLISAPKGMELAPDKEGSLKWNGLTVIQFCLHTQGTKGSFFLKDHLLLFVKSGVYTVKYRNQKHTVRSNEMIFLHKAIKVEYEKSGEPGTEYLLDYIMFYLNGDILHKFADFAEWKTNHSTDDVVPVSVVPVNAPMRAYIASLKSYFNQSDSISDGLIGVKFMELLFHLAETNTNLLQQLLHPHPTERSQIAQIVEENVTNPVSIEDLAYLSGRSLSTFKREFRALYNSSPLRWIRNRRLDLASQLLLETTQSVTDICYACGFENTTHFSKVFKLRFELSPTEYRRLNIRKE